MAAFWPLESVSSQIILLKNLTINEDSRESWLLGIFWPHAALQGQSQNFGNVAPFPHLPWNPSAMLCYFRYFWQLSYAPCSVPNYEVLGAKVSLTFLSTPGQ